MTVIQVAYCYLLFGYQPDSLVLDNCNNVLGKQVIHTLNLSCFVSIEAIQITTMPLKLRSNSTNSTKQEGKTRCEDNVFDYFIAI